VQNLRKLVEDVLDLSRIGRGRLELRKQTVPLGPILRAGAEDACRARGAKEGTVLIAAEGDVAAGEWDPDRVRQVVRNLVDNGIVHGRQEVRVVVDEISAERVRFSVRDKGPGIAPERRNEVLQPFVRHERDVGHGLGLALASEITRAHGGKLWIGDDEGAGCGVFVELPRG
jgi:signal transduction histidine kinase